MVGLLDRIGLAFQGNWHSAGIPSSRVTRSGGRRSSRRAASCRPTSSSSWCDDHGIDPLDATRAEIEILARELETTGRRLATVASKLNALSGFYRFAVIDGVLDRDPPMLNVRRPRIERIFTTQGLTRTEFADVLRTVETMEPRAHALICLLGLNGLRVSETCNLDIGRHRPFRADSASVKFR